MMEEYDICRVCSLEIPEQCNMYTVQARTFIYGGSKVPSLTHCYEIPSTKHTFMAHMLLANPPSFEDIKESENVIIKSAKYHGTLTITLTPTSRSTGLQEYSQLQRPIVFYYSPPLVDIVKDDTGNVRAVLVDAAYFYTNAQPPLENVSKDCFILINDKKNQVIEFMQRNEYTKAEQAYRAFSIECMKHLPERSTECPWRI